LTPEDPGPTFGDVHDARLYGHLRPPVRVDPPSPKEPAMESFQNLFTQTQQKALAEATQLAEKISSTWKETWESQRQAFSQATAQLSQSVKIPQPEGLEAFVTATLARAQTQLEETSKLMTATLSWVSELQSGLVKQAVEALKTGAETFKKPAA
jgi:hypothetical protein